MEQKTEDKKKYMKKYFEKPEIKENYNDYHRDWMRNKRHPTEKKTEDVRKVLEDMKKYPANFPGENFNKKLDDILKNNPPEVEEKTLKDLIHDILNKEGLLTPVRIMNLYYNPNWANAIEEFMNEKDYVKEGDKYVKKPK